MEVILSARLPDGTRITRKEQISVFPTKGLHLELLVNEVWHEFKITEVEDVADSFFVNLTYLNPVQA